MKKVLKFALSDFKLIFRDSSLKVFFMLPVLLFSLMIWAVPPLIEKYPFLEPYKSLFLVVAIIENTQMFSFISSMVLIDEKETDVAKVFGIVPLRKSEYLISRFLIPFLFTVMLNVVMFLIQPLYPIPLTYNILISIIAGMVVPVYALFINSIVQNRMQGMVYIKAFNMLVLIPIAAFFVPEQAKHWFGFFPTHWIFQSIDFIGLGVNPGYMILIGFIFFIGLTWYSTSLFFRKHFV